MWGTPLPCGCGGGCVWGGGGGGGGGTRGLSRNIKNQGMELNSDTGQGGGFRAHLSLVFTQLAETEREPFRQEDPAARLQAPCGAGHEMA